MATGCAWDLIAFGTNLDGSGGLVAQKLAAGETKYTGNGAAGAATQVYPNEDGAIGVIMGFSEDGAMTEWRVRKTADPNYIRSHMFQKGQTERGDLDQVACRVNYPVMKGDKLTCDITNAAAKMDGVLIAIGKGIVPTLTQSPPAEIPAGAIWVSATMATTATADTWTSGAITLENYNLKRDKQYKVLGAVANGATLVAIRFAPLTGPDSENRPGIFGGDTDQINVPTYFGQPFVFDGLTGMNGEILCTAGDTATNINLLIQEM
jgi:hypothetical protein